MALGLALLLNRPFPGRTFFRTMLILPWVVSQLLTALLWRWLDSPLLGPLAYVLGVLTDSRVDILGDPSTAMGGVIVANVWRTFPYAMILILAALQTIPYDLYEAARIDGAGRWNVFRYVTFPMIQNTFLIATIILSVHYFNMIELPLVLTGGGPVNRTELLGLRVYREAFVLFKFGFGAAIAMIMFIINIVVSLAYIKILRAESRY
jgi:ABC-type sugar transport system permease subunit